MKREGIEEEYSRETDSSESENTSRPRSVWDRDEEKNLPRLELGDIKRRKKQGRGLKDEY